MDMKLSCDAAAPLIARHADDALTDEDRVLLEKHLDACDGCRGVLRAQREVAALLRTRVPDARVDLASRISARLDDEAGVFGLANWRAWTLGLAPVAAALMLAAYLGLGASASTVSQSATAGDEWATAATSVLMQPAASADVLLEEVLTGSAESSGGARDVR
jgi:predicted anti-sigma-YlaC factor YlaD